MDISVTVFSGWCRFHDTSKTLRTYSLIQRTECNKEEKENQNDGLWEV